MKTIALHNKESRFGVVALLSAILLTFVAPTQAALLVYEGFNGYTAGVLSNQSVTNTTGLTGSYSATGGPISASSTGLTFSNLQTSGGSALNATNTGSAIGVTMGGFSSVTGSLYSSQLVSLTGSNNGILYTRINTVPSSTLWFVSAANLNAHVAAGYDSGSSESSVSLAMNTTYILLQEYTNVGTALGGGTTGVATIWALTNAQYTNFKLSGLTTAALNSASVGGLAGNVTARVSDSWSAGTFTFAPGNAFQFNLTGATTGSGYTLDEVRYGTTLADVTPIPEPGSCILVGMGMAATLYISRRRRSLKASR